MTLALTGVSVLVVLTYAGTVAGLLKYLKDQQTTWDSERQTLLNRIVAPQTIPTESFPEHDGEIRAIQPDDQKAYWAAKGVED